MDDGTGIMGADHVGTITAAISGAEVRAIADIDPRRAEMIASRVPGAQALSTAECLVELPEVDGVIMLPSATTSSCSLPFLLDRDTLAVTAQPRSAIRIPLVITRQCFH
jgi:hypothetical protein